MLCRKLCPETIWKMFYTAIILVTCDVLIVEAALCLIEI